MPVERHPEYASPRRDGWRRPGASVPVSLSRQPRARLPGWNRHQGCGPGGCVDRLRQQTGNGPGLASQRSDFSCMSGRLRAGDSLRQRTPGRRGAEADLSGSSFGAGLAVSGGPSSGLPVGSGRWGVVPRFEFAWKTFLRGGRGVAGEPPTPVRVGHLETLSRIWKACCDSRLEAAPWRGRMHSVESPARVSLSSGATCPPNRRAGTGISSS